MLNSTNYKFCNQMVMHKHELNMENKNFHNFSTRWTDFNYMKIVPMLIFWLSTTIEVNDLYAFFDMNFIKVMKCKCFWNHQSNCLKSLMTHYICPKTFICRFPVVPTTIPIHHLTLKMSTLHLNCNTINIQHSKFFFPFHFFCRIIWRTCLINTPLCNVPLGNHENKTKKPLIRLWLKWKTQIGVVKTWNHNMSMRSQNTLTTLQRYVQSFMKYDA